MLVYLNWILLACFELHCNYNGFNKIKKIAFLQYSAGGNTKGNYFILSANIKYQQLKMKSIGKRIFKYVNYLWRE